MSMKIMNSFFTEEIKQIMMIFPKQSIGDVFFLSHLANQTYLEVKWIMKVKSIHTDLTEEGTMSKYHATRIPPK